MYSTDHDYRATSRRLTAPNQDAQTTVTEVEVFRILDNLRPTATGLDGIPAWFLRLGAAIFAAPIATLFNQSVLEGVVPRQWKAAIITPVPKVNEPKQLSDYRPISITSVLSRSFERYVVKTYIYSALLEPPPGLDFTDQYAFRPTGSTDAAIITLLHTVLTMLSSNEYVRVIALDFSKAFDTIRHATLIEKMSRLQLPDHVYNWIKDFFDGHCHCTKFAGNVSAHASIQASVIQGSGIGPVSYIVTAADLRPVHDNNRLVKFADDTYLIVPGKNSESCAAEIAHIQEWAKKNNLRLNCAKTKELIFRGKGSRRRSTSHGLPPPLQDIERVTNLSVLGVVINDRLTAADHVSGLLTTCSRLLYALRVLRSHGLPASSMHDVFRSTVIARLMYCSTAWSGFCSAADRSRMDAFLRRCQRLGYCSSDTLTVAEMFERADDKLFSHVLANTNHVLQQHLPERPNSQYNTRTRTHNKTLITKTTDLNDRDFLIRMLYKDCY